MTNTTKKKPTTNKNIKKATQKKTTTKKKTTSKKKVTTNKSTTNKQVEKEPTLKEKGLKATKAYLRNKGYEILSTKFKAKAGTIDIVAKEDEDILVFIKLITRSDISNGMPKDSVSLKERCKFECIAAEYLSKNNYVNMSIRFDKIALLVCGDDKAMIRHHINALVVG